MGEDEHVVVVRRVVSPPTLPLLIPPVPAAHGPEHVAAHDAGADVLERLLHDPRALVHLAALLVMRLAPSGQRNGPVMQSLPTLAERVLLALVRAGDESVCRDRDVTPELAHRASSVGGRLDRGDIDVSRTVADTASTFRGRSPRNGSGAAYPRRDRNVRRGSDPHRSHPEPERSAVALFGSGAWRMA
jgi:hypothetical protein